MPQVLRTLLALMAGVTILATATDGASALGKRVALVIGNSAYIHTGALTNPKNDASDVAVALKKLGFQVVEGVDVDKATFDRKVRDFANALEGATVGLFSYAGHGLAVEGQNYLVPVDAELTTAVALEFEMVRADTVHRVMERQTKTNIIFLDACRDNPLSRNLARSMGTRSAAIGKGLAPIESGVGTLISFSTQPGNVASDGAGRNSPFAGALVKHLSTSHDDLSAILIAVRNDVMKATDHKQVPWEHSALTGRFYFAAQRTIASSPAQLSSSQHWDLLRDAPPSNRFSADDLQRFTAIAKKNLVPVPDFAIRKLADNVPEKHRRFVGVWISNKEGWDNKGRQFAVIVTNVDAQGYAVGHMSRGPPNASSYSKSPAAHFPFAGQISGEYLAIKLGASTMRASFDEQQRIKLVEQNNDGRQTSVVLERAWNLVDVEKRGSR